MTFEVTEQVDVVIVGSGPSGASFARTIRDEAPEATILIVEAGPVVADPPGLHVANIIDPVERERAQISSQGPDKYRYDDQLAEAGSDDLEERERALLHRPGLFRVGAGPVFGAGFSAAQAASNVGGMGSHWFACCPRPSEVERIPYLERDVLDEAYDVAEGYLKVSASQFADSAFAAHVRSVVGATVNAGRAPDRMVQAMPMAVRLTPHGVERAGPDVILGDLLAGGGSGFELRSSTLCTQILMDEEQARGVEVRDLATGRVHRIGASAVVVAADSLRTPQLLFASSIRPAALGRHLNEHPQVTVMARVHGFADNAPRAREQGETSTMADASAVSVAASGVTWIPYDADTFPAHANLVQVDPASLSGGGIAGSDGAPAVSVHLFLPQQPLWDNRVEFDPDNPDWLGMPGMTMHVEMAEHDLAVIEQAKQNALSVARALGAPADGESPWVLPPGSSLHYQGTVRMGAVDDGASVCDRTCRVWGTQNLYVGGNGVIPLATACNPTLTSVALAVLGGRHIAAQFAGVASNQTILTNKKEYAR